VTAAGLQNGYAQLTGRALFDWNDLRFLLAVARHCSTTAAGKALGLSQSTVHRRIGALEAGIGKQLVTRHASGSRLTDFATALLPQAELVAAAVTDIERQIAESAHATAGTVRMTCPEPIVFRLTQSAFLDRFHECHPGLHVEFVTSDRYIDLTQGDADVALRSGDTDADLVGMKVANSHWAVYAARTYVERHGAPQSEAEMAAHPLVSLDDAARNHRAPTWLRAVAPGARISASSSSVLGLVSAVKSGVGIGALPTALGDAEMDLVRVLGPIAAMTRSWRLLTTASLRRTPRIAAFFDFVKSEKRALQPILSG
jgi:DNA-binding transcriptional LysR family regulator